MSKLFYLTSRYGDCGSTVLFHNKDGRGYSSSLDKLHKFTLEEAQKHLDQDIDSLPLEVEAVNEKATMRVDMQVLPEVVTEPSSYNKAQYVIRRLGAYDGNDIPFLSKSNQPYDYQQAIVFTWGEVIIRIRGEEDSYAVYAKYDLDEIARPTFQRKNVNISTMVRGGGIKYKPPRKPRPTTGKTRFNCPSCGKLNWQYHPYEFERCGDRMCDLYHG